MKESELVEQLTGFGIDEREARVYYHLSRLGPSRASEVSQASGVQRTEVYRVMDRLEQQGFVEKTLERPRKFLAVPIEEALERQLDRRSRELESLEEASEELAERWPRAKASREGTKQRFSVHQGRSQIQGLLERMIEEADDEVILMAPRRGFNRLDTMGVLDPLLDRASRGLSARILTEIEEEEDDASSTLAGFAEEADIRHVELPGYAQLVIVDNEQIALFVSLDPLVSTRGTGETVLWLNAQDFILAQKALFDTLWAAGVDHDERVEELASGDPAERVDVVRGRWMRYNRMKEMLYRAEERVRYVATAAEVDRLERAGLLRVLERLASDEVEVRLLVEDPSEIDLEGVQVEHASRSPGLVYLEVDGDEVLAVTGSATEPGSMSHEGEWAVWVTVDDAVEHLCTVIDDQWDAAAPRATGS